MKHLLKINHILSFTLLIFLLGCKSKEVKVTEFIDGGYILNKIEYDGKDITSNVVAAILSFDTDNGSKFKPPIVSNMIGKSEKYDWTLLESQDNIKIRFDTDNEIFKDIFNISFKIDDSNNQIHLYMRSRNTYISSTRLFIMENYEEVKRDLLLLSNW